MNSPVEEIKNRIDIVDFLRSYLELKPAGRNLKAKCPFHNEKTASFMVSPERQTWHCFGSCSEGGDIFKFLMKYENIEFYEALKILADKAGVELKKISPSDQKQFGILYDINETAKNYFKDLLAGNDRAKSYLKERRLSDETISEFEIGFSAAGYDNLTLHLINLGYDIKDIERAGLNFKSERGNYMDRFRNRIMFPIYNHFGKIIGFSGRILPEFDTGEMGKYINSPETPIFSKSRVLYGFHKSKNHIRDNKKAFLVEGQMDFLMCWQDGIKNAVASSGTALTLEHLKTLERLTDELVFSFDSDEAGLKAAERAIDMANNLDMNAKILVFEEFKDPAEAVMKKPGYLKTIIDSAKSAMEFYFSHYLPKTSENDFSENKKNVRAILSKIKIIISPIEQMHWLKELGHKIGMDEKVLFEEMNQIKNYLERKDLDEDTFKKTVIRKDLSRADLISHRLLILTLALEQINKETKNNLFESISQHLRYLSGKVKNIFEAAISGKKGTDPEIASLLENYSLQASLEVEKLEEDKAQKEFFELLRQLKSEYFKSKQEEAAKAIKQAETKKDEQALVEALKQFDEISRLLHNN